MLVCVTRNDRSAYGWVVPSSIPFHDSRWFFLGFFRGASQGMERLCYLPVAVVRSAEVVQLLTRVISSFLSRTSLLSLSFGSLTFETLRGSNLRGTWCLWRSPLLSPLTQVVSLSFLIASGYDWPGVCRRLQILHNQLFVKMSAIKWEMPQCPTLNADIFTSSCFINSGFHYKPHTWDCNEGSVLSIQKRQCRWMPTCGRVTISLVQLSLNVWHVLHRMTAFITTTANGETFRLHFDARTAKKFCPLMPDWRNSFAIALMPERNK